MTMVVYKEMRKQNLKVKYPIKVAIIGKESEEKKKLMESFEFTDAAVYSPRRYEDYVSDGKVTYKIEFNDFYCEDEYFEANLIFLKKTDLFVFVYSSTEPLDLNDETFAYITAIEQQFMNQNKGKYN